MFSFGSLSRRRKSVPKTAPPHSKSVNSASRSRGRRKGRHMGNGPTKGGVMSSEEQKDFQRSLREHQEASKEYEYLAKLTHFDEKTLRLLHARFLGIDSTIEEDGTISLEEFGRVLGVPRESLLLQRFFSFMDQHKMGSLNFRNFACTMSMLSERAVDKEKMELSFFVYDLNNDGNIDPDELRQLVEASLQQSGMTLTEAQVAQIVNNTFDACDSNKNGLIDKEEYFAYCEKNPRILQPFKIDINQLIVDELDYRRQSRLDAQELHKVLHHGVLDTPKASHSGWKKMTRSVGKKMNQYTHEQVVTVQAVHTVSDLMPELAETDGVVRSNSINLDGYRADADKGMSGFKSDGEGYNRRKAKKKKRKSKPKKIRSRSKGPTRPKKRKEGGSAALLMKR